MFKRFLAVVLAVAMVAAFVPAAVANPDIVIGSGGLTTVADIKGAIEAVTGGTVTVTGSMTGVSETLTLNIPEDVTVKWAATFESVDSFPPNEALIEISGEGTFEVVGGNISVSGEYSYAINAAAKDITVTVSGGTVSASGYRSTAIFALESEVTVNGGTISASGDNNAVAIYAMSNSTVTVSGNGEVSASGNQSCAINATDSTVTVTGGKVKAEGFNSKAIHADSSTVTVSGGTISASVERSTAIFAYGSIVTVTGGEVKAEGEMSCAITAVNGSTVIVSGGEVSAEGDRSCAIDADSSAVTVSGGEVSAEGGGTAIITHDSKVTLSGGTVSAGDSHAISDNNESKSTVTIDGAVTVSGMIAADITIESGATLTIPNGSVLWVSSMYDKKTETTVAFTLTNKGTINNFGTLENLGEITNSGSIYNYGTIYNNNGTIQNKGTIYSDSPIAGDVTTVPLPKAPETSEIPYYIYFEPTPPAPPVSAADTPSDWAKAAVEQARKLGLVPEHLDGSWRRWLNRAEFAAFAVLLYEYLDGRTITAWSLFDDTTDVNVEKLAGLGIVKGDGTGIFNPNGNFSREMALTLMYNILVKLGYYLPPSEPSFSDADSISPWAREAIGALQRAGIIKGDGTRFNAQETFSREMGVVTMAQILEWVAPLS